MKFEILNSVFYKFYVGNLIFFTFLILVLSHPQLNLITFDE